MNTWDTLCGRSIPGVAESRRQVDQFGMDHFQLYKNRADVRKLGQNFNKKSRRKLNCTKTRAYGNQGLTVYANITKAFQRNQKTIMIIQETKENIDKQSNQISL